MSRFLIAPSPHLSPVFVHDTSRSSLHFLSFMSQLYGHSTPINAIATDYNSVAALLEAQYSIWLGKAFNVAALTFVSWDFALTFNDEIEYIWKRRWNTMRVLYTVTRYFIPVSISVNSITLFHPTISPRSCDIVTRIGATFALVAISAMMVLLLVRVWVMWDKSTWMLVALLALFSGMQIVSVTSIITAAHRMHAIENPLPGIMTGCVVPSTNQPDWFRVLLSGLIYETIVFSLTVYQAWRSYKRSMRTPLLAHLVRDGALYFLVVAVVVLLTLIGTTYTATLPAALGSGMYISVMSSMCCRLVLRLRSYAYTAPTISPIEDDLPMTTLPPSSRSENPLTYA